MTAEPKRPRFQANGFKAKLVRTAAQVLQILQEYQNERSDCKKSGDDAGIR